MYPNIYTPNFQLTSKQKTTIRKLLLFQLLFCFPQQRLRTFFCASFSVPRGDKLGSRCLYRIFNKYNLILINKHLAHYCVQYSHVTLILQTTVLYFLTLTRTKNVIYYFVLHSCNKNTSGSHFSNIMYYIFIRCGKLQFILVWENIQHDFNHGIKM